MIDRKIDLSYAAMENFKKLTDKKEVLKEEIKGLKKNIRKMKRKLKIKMEEFYEINEELRDLENQDNGEDNIVCDAHPIATLDHRRLTASCWEECHRPWLLPRHTSLI